MASSTVDELQDPYLDALDITTLEHLNIYNNTIVGQPEGDRYDVTISKWTKFYQELEYDVLIFWFKAEILIVTSIYLNQAPTEFNNIISFYP